MYDFGKASMEINKKNNTRIYLADDVIIECNANYKWWHKMFVKLFFGWRVEKITNKQ